MSLWATVRPVVFAIPPVTVATWLYRRHISWIEDRIQDALEAASGPVSVAMLRNRFIEYVLRDVGFDVESASLWVRTRHLFRCSIFRELPSEQSLRTRLRSMKTRGL